MQTVFTVKLQKQTKKLHEHCKDPIEILGTEVFLERMATESTEFFTPKSWYWYNILTLAQYTLDRDVTYS